MFRLLLSFVSGQAELPRSVTHPTAPGINWKDRTHSVKIGSGCTARKCTNTSANIPEGVLYKCWGPLELPISSGKLYRFLPEVDMNTVHHMIAYWGGCNGRGNMLFAWARTGQTQPIGLDLDSWAPFQGFGYDIGRSPRQLSLQIHYQAKVPTVDRSGLRIWYSLVPPKTPLVLNINALMPYIPAHTVADNCIACGVVHGGTIFGYRNHAHKLGRDIWSDRFAPDGSPREPVGLISSQHPQVIRKFAQPLTLQPGETLQVHCVYDNSAGSMPSGPGSDENGEMCNQYLLSDLNLRMQCDYSGRKLNHTCKTSPHVYVDAHGTAHRRPKRPM